MTRVNDVLVASFTSANTDLEQLGEAMKYAGPVAAAAGVNFEEAAAALSLMGNAGIQGSMAGTSLRGAISRILNPTKQVREAMEEAGLSFTDAQGRLLPLADIIEQLEPHAEDAGLMMELFGQRAGPAMAALVGQGSEAMRDFVAMLLESGGTAERIAAVQMAGLNGVLRQLASAWDELQLAISDAGLLDWATEGAEALTLWIRELGETDPAMLRFITVTAMGIAVIGPLILGIGLMASTLAALMTPIGLVIAGIMALVAAGAWLYVNWDTIAERLGDIWAGLGERGERIWDGLVEIVAGSVDAVRALMDGDLAAAGEALERAWAGLAAAAREMFDGASEWFASIDWSGHARAAIDTAWEGLSAGWAALEPRAREMLNEASEWFGSVDWSNLGETLGRKLVDGIIALVSGAGSLVSSAFNALLNSAKQDVDWSDWGAAAASIVSGLARGIMAGAGAIGGALVEFVVGLLRGMGGAVADAVAEWMGVEQLDFSALVEAMRQAGIDAGAAIVQAIKDAFDDLMEWFRGLPGRIVAAIGEIDLGSIIQWPAPPAWWQRLFGGGEADAANDNMPAGTVAAERALDVARQLADLQAQADGGSWWPFGGGVEGEINALTEELDRLTAALPESAQAGMRAYVDAIAGEGGAASAEAQAIADEMLATLNVTARPEIDTSSFDGAISKVRQLDSALRNLPNTSVSGPAVAGARAEGGPVERGRPYIVGEKGWEIFVPDMAGTIVPHHEAMRVAGRVEEWRQAITPPANDNPRPAGNDNQAAIGGAKGFATMGAGTTRHEVGGRIVVEAAEGTRIREVTSDNPDISIEPDRGPVVGRA